jgi:hypothetical protein
MNIKVSHESPLCLLKDSVNYNDYDYALVHLFEHNPHYYHFFRSSVLANREVLLDNSIFELGKAFESEEYYKWITKLEPTYYIVPDVWEDADATIISFDKFVTKYDDIKSLKIGATQGKTYRDFVRCYKYMSDHADYIAVSFAYSYFEWTGLGNNKYERMVNGRQKLIQNLIDDGIWNWNKPHHLLGCALPQEFRYYYDKNIYNIRSVDTSNPVMAGFNYMKYSGDLGLKDKPKGLLADNISTTLDDDQLDLIKYNIESFKQIVGRK